MRAATAMLLAAGLVAGQPARLEAQIASSTLTGRVLDANGAAVTGAIVVLTAADTAVSRTVASGPGGVYAVPGLPPGNYRLRVEAPGFDLLRREPIGLMTGETVWIDVRLTIAGVAESVVVGAEAPIIQSDRPGLGQIIANRALVGLPLNGRSFVALTGLAPGVALPPGSLLPRINGGRPRTNEYLFDGISVLQPEPGQVAFFPNIDAIHEFRVETNSPPAEFGRFNGGVINLTTRAGANELAGSVFEFFRHEALNARHYFARSNQDTPGFRRDQFGGVVGGPLRRNRTFFFVDYQGQRQTIGRTATSTVPTVLQRQGIFAEPVAGRVPIVHDPATTTTAPGGQAVREPFPANTIPADRVDPVARALLGRYPLPTAEGTANNFRRVADETVDQDQGGVRIDHRLSAGRDHVFARVTRVREVFLPVPPLPDGSGAATGTLGPQRTGAWSFASSYQRVVSGTIVHELRVGHTRRAVRRTAAELAAPAGASLGLPGLPTSHPFDRVLPTIAIAGYQQLGSPPNTATAFDTSVTELADTVTWVNGRHTVKAGADLRWQRLDVVQPPSPMGTFAFTSLFTDQPGIAGTGSPFASFLLGQVERFSIDHQDSEIRHRAHAQEYFVQDDWRLSDRLTVNAGVRYTLNFPSTETRNQSAVFNTRTKALEYLGRDGHPRSARRLHRLNLGPRLGAAARLDDRTAVRGGYAVVWIEQAGITTPFTAPVFPFLQTVSARTLDNVRPAFLLADGPDVEAIPLTADAGLGQGVFAVDRNLGSGYVQQWNASVQREIAPRVVLEVAYVGSKITRVGIPDANLNQLTVEQLALGPALLERVPNPYFGVIPRSSSLGDPTITRAQLMKPFPEHTTVSFYRHNVGTTSYHGVHARLEQRLRRGLSYLVSYTRSRLVDDASSVFDASVLTGPVANAPVADSYNRRLERDVSTGDIPQVLSASAVFDVPIGAGRRWTPGGMWEALLGGWTLSGILTIQSGVPVAVTQATNFNAFAGFGTQRPNLVGDPALPRGERTVDRWFDTSAFEVAPQFTLGSASRNPVRGPGYRNLDVAFVRRLGAQPGHAVEIRVEIFNLTNAAALGPPNGVLGAPAFGSITTAGDPRVAQLGIKYLF